MYKGFKSLIQGFLCVDRSVNLRKDAITVTIRMRAELDHV